MRARPPRSSRTDTRFPDTSLVRSCFFDPALDLARLGLYAFHDASQIAKRIRFRFHIEASILALRKNDFVALLQIAGAAHFGRQRDLPRSEEHTSGLQSLMRISYAVFCLTKKTRNTTTHT